jgi:WD40 repeat protein
MFSTTAQTPSICSSNSELYRLIKSRAINNDIVVSFSNFSFTDFALNWIKSLQQLKITNYLMFALDQNSYNFFVQRNICSYLIDKTDKLFTEESQNFGSLGFIAICNVKPWLVHELLKAGFNVVWSDTDIVWLRDPFPVFYYNKSIDLQIQSDDDDICAGFFYAKSNAKTIRFFDRVVNYTSPVIDDQTAMRRYLQDDTVSQRVGTRDEDHALKVKRTAFIDYWKQLSAEDDHIKEESDSQTHLMRYLVLDRALFPNGTAYFNAKLPQRFSISPVIVHNNCIIGHEPKKLRFMLYKLWFLHQEKVYNHCVLPPTCIQTQCLHILKGHNEIVTALEFAIDDTSLFSASYDKSLRIWNYKTGKLLACHFLNKRGGFWTMQLVQIDSDVANNLQEGTSHSDPFVTKDKSSPPKYALFTGSHDKTIQQWDIESWQNVKVMKGHYGAINSIHVYKDKIFSASDDGSCRSWNLKHLE